MKGQGDSTTLNNENGNIRNWGGRERRRRRRNKDEPERGKTNACSLTLHLQYSRIIPNLI